MVCRYSCRSLALSDRISEPSIFCGTSETHPFFAFFTVATETGTLTFTWTGDDGKSYVEKASITVA